MKTTKITTIFLGMASAMAFAQEGSACIPFVNGTGNYDKHCYNEGLIDMEEGKCYTFNPARVAEAPVQQWVNNIASQTWWWVETPCIEEVSSSSVEPESSSSEIVEPESSSSEIVEPESSSSEIVEPESSSSETPVSSSSAEPIVVSNCIEFVNGSGNFTENCYNAGLLEMEEGKCYALNEDRYNDVKNQLWINNVASQVWWWKVVPCGTEISSSSVEESSSSEEVSSSSEEPESSSSEEVSSSSEEPESSSSVEESSSSEVIVSKCEEFVRGTGNYTTDKCYNAGLADMEEGKCYKLKDDRANDVKGQQWINDRANDNWWWEETECGEVVVSSSSEEVSSSSEESSSSVESSSSEESSSSVESSSSEESSSSVESSSSEIVVTKCVEFVNGSGDYNGKCFNAGLNEMAEGKCYALNPDRGQVNDIWINNRAVDTYWWSEVSCGDDVVAPKAEPKPAPAKVIGRDNGTTAIATAVAAKASMAVANNMLSIATTSNGTKSVKVFSVRGDVLLSETFSGAAKTVDMAQFAGKGAVIVRLVEGRKVLATKRIAVR